MLAAAPGAARARDGRAMSPAAAAFVVVGALLFAIAGASLAGGPSARGGGRRRAGLSTRGGAAVSLFGHGPLASPRRRAAAVDGAEVLAGGAGSRFLPPARAAWGTRADVQALGPSDDRPDMLQELLPVLRNRVGRAEPHPDVITLARRGCFGLEELGRRLGWRASSSPALIRESAEQGRGAFPRALECSPPPRTARPSWRPRAPAGLALAGRTRAAARPSCNFQVAKAVRGWRGCQRHVSAHIASRWSARRLPADRSAPPVSGRRRSRRRRRPGPPPNDTLVRHAPPARPRSKRVDELEDGCGAVAGAEVDGFRGNAAAAAQVAQGGDRGPSARVDDVQVVRATPVAVRGVCRSRHRRTCQLRPLAGPRPWAM